MGSIPEYFKDASEGMMKGVAKCGVLGDGDEVVNINVDIIKWGRQARAWGAHVGR